MQRFQEKEKYIEKSKRKSKDVSSCLYQDGFAQINPLWKKIPIVMLKRKIRKNLVTLCLILGTFFNPLGFDVAFALVTKWTGSYVITDLIFYFISAVFFGLYFFLKKDKT